VTLVFNRNILILLAIIFCSAHSFSQAKGGKRLKISKLGIVYQTFSGDRNKSLADGAASYGAELSVDAGGEYIRYFMKTKVMYSVGKQNFLDDTTEVKSNYNITQIMPELGLSFYPVARKNRGLNLYLWGVGVVSYNVLELSPISSTAENGTVSPVTSYTKLNSRDQGFGYGGGGGFGFEIIAGSGKTGQYTMYGEAGFRQQITQLAKQSQFQLNSIQFVVGIGF
jgi:hypothetical protein